MKRLTDRYRRWLWHRQRYVRRRHHHHSIVDVITNQGRWATKASTKTRHMPAVLCFDRNGTETLAALADLRRRLRTRMRGIRGGTTVSKHRGAKPRWSGSYQKFETIKSITPSAALVLAAEYERAIIRSGGGSVRVIDAHKWQPEVIDILWDIGFFDIVGLPQNLEKPDLKANFAILPMRSGDTADGPAVTSLIKDLLLLYPGAAAETQGKMLPLYGAMVEGIVNVVSHAYPAGDPTGSSPVRRWWMTGAVDRDEGWTTAVIFDQGITIPVSLPNWELYAGYKRRMLSKIGLVPQADDPKSDGQAIAAAVEESVSSTGESHRGHGLAQMRDFVDQCREGHLRIISRHGEVVFRTGGQREIKTHDASIGGTLIEWSALL